MMTVLLLLTVLSATAVFHHQQQLRHSISAVSGGVFAFHLREWRRLRLPPPPSLSSPP
ncbi:hypothetical protein Hanom_Chr00s097520g01802001 [Helianthus anomalus]